MISITFMQIIVILKFSFTRYKYVIIDRKHELNPLFQYKSAHSAKETTPLHCYFKFVQISYVSLFSGGGTKTVYEICASTCLQDFFCREH